MKKNSPTVLHFLFDRHLARRFAQHVETMEPGSVSLLMQSLLSAALIDPSFLVKHIRKYDFLERQISTQRGLIKPEVISIHCRDDSERRALCRTILAVTVEVSAKLDATVLPDPTTVIAALVECWVAEKVAKRKKAEPNRKKPKLGHSRPAKRFRRDDLPPLVPPRKPKAKIPKSGDVQPHPDYPDVAKKPIAWRPGTRGRPPKEAWTNGRGAWLPPPGWRVIRGRWHQPISDSADAAEAVGVVIREEAETSAGEDPAGGDEHQEPPPRLWEDPAQPPPTGDTPA